MSAGAAAAPAGLGRGVIVADGAEAPAAWSEAPRFRLAPELLEDAPMAAALANDLRDRWIAREPVVVDLGLDPGVLREPVSVDRVPYSLSPKFDLPFDRLHHLIWANNYDAREPGEQIWWWAAKAARLGAANAEGEGDVVLAGAGAAWIDGGPRWQLPELTLRLVQSGARPRAAAGVVAALTGTAPNDLYRELTGREPRR